MEEGRGKNMEAATIFDRLYEKIENFGFGLGTGPNQEEMKWVLSRFDEEDALYYLAGPNEFWSEAQYADALGKTVLEVAPHLYSMSRRGLLFRERKEDGHLYYCINTTAHGMFEFNLNRTTDEQQGFLKALGPVTAKRYYAMEPLHRTLPIRPEAVAEGELLDTDDVRKIIDSHERFAVATCVCSMPRRLGPDHKCDFNTEKCINFDTWADYYVENGDGRYVTKEEILERLEMADTGPGCNVHVANFQNPEIICLCCKCCCGMLKAARYFPGEANKRESNYKMHHDESKCTNCTDICVPRCAMGAITQVDGTLQFDQSKCCGCGLCVTACPQGANILHRKPDDELYTPPGEDWHQTFDAITQGMMEVGVAKKDYREIK